MRVGVGIRGHGRVASGRCDVKFGSLFAGIGGFDLGLERSGMRCEFQVEINDYANKVLERHWPSVPRFGDIRECGKRNLAPVDVICGGFPCQPFSVAGKRRGKDDDRYLWPEMLRVISEMRPRWVIGENVAGFINMGLDVAFADLEAEGYEVEAIVLPACGVNAPHQRYRVFIVAHAVCNAEGATYGTGSDRWGADSQQDNRDGVGDDAGDCGEGEWRGIIESQLGRVADGLPPRLDGYRGLSAWDGDWEGDTPRVATGVKHRVDRLKCLGNAVVPQLVEVIGRAIMEVEGGAL